MNLNVANHVAIILDGNRRWAKKNGLPILDGHRKGVETLMSVIKWSIELKIHILTVYAFSCENWKRPANEVENLMSLFVEVINSVLDKSKQEDPVNQSLSNVRLKFIGRKDRLSEVLQSKLKILEEQSKMNDEIIVNIAIDYSGQWDIAQSCIQTFQQEQLLSPNGKIDFQNVNVDSIIHGISNNLSTSQSLTVSNGCSQIKDTHSLDDEDRNNENDENEKDDGNNVDVLIRTGNEFRLSNFLLWQISYSELIVLSELWPEVTREIYVKCIDSFCSERQRRFGK